MTDSTECACGCGGKITSFDPSPDFRWPHCQKLWLHSLDKADPDIWRAEQRILTLLMRQDFAWSATDWSFGWTDCHIAQYDEHGDVPRGLVNLYAHYDNFLRDWGATSDLPVLVRG